MHKMSVAVCASLITVTIGYTTVVSQVSTHGQSWAKLEVALVLRISITKGTSSRQGKS